MKRRFVTLAAFGLALFLAVPAAPLRAAPAQLELVTSFSILADLARQIGGERVNVTSLVGPDEDAHGYQPRPSDARRILSANVVIANGLAFDPWLERLARSTGHPEPVVIASDGIRPIEISDGHAHHDGHDHGSLDPHAWQDVANVKTYVTNIASALARVDPPGATAYEENLARYLGELDALDAEIRSTISIVPIANRKVVTTHDAFGYFGRSYGIHFVAAAGVSNHAEVSAAGMARLIRQLRRERAAVVFVENINDQRLIERIGSEGGARVGGTLYTDALSGPDGPAPTYLDMMRHNLRTLMEGLMPEHT